MAILAVKIEHEASLLMNEFFDYNGLCCAISCSRGERREECINLEDFYECTIRTNRIEDVPVVFLAEDQIIGWYEKAEICRSRRHISMFLEGNMTAPSVSARLLPKSERISGIPFNFQNKFYEVIESGDERLDRIQNLMNTAKSFVPICFSQAGSFYSADRLRLIGQKYRKNKEEAFRKMYDYCIEKCEETAQRVMNDLCMDIRELKTMYAYAKQSLIYQKNSVDGLYYLAMACDQLGFVKEGLKAIGKAVQAEPDGDDLYVMKGHLLFAAQKYEEAAQSYQEAVDINPDDNYLIYLAQTKAVQGNMDAAYKIYKKVSDPSLLDEKGIRLKDMERRWPFAAAIRGFSLKDLFRK